MWEGFLCWTDTVRDRRQGSFVPREGEGYSGRETKRMKNWVRNFGWVLVV
jgi:hypothetical protein